MNRRVLVASLRVLGYATDVAADGQEALDAGLRGIYDLVFLDLMMPELDGLETARRLRTNGGACVGVPIIALTANCSPEDASQCLAAGMDAILTKPIDYNHLKTEIAARLM